MKTFLIAVLLVVSTVATLIVADGDVGTALVPALVIAAFYAIWRLPLRYPALALTFLALTLENPSDAPAMGLWKSPLYTAGAVLLAHLNVTFPMKWMLFSGVDVVLVFLFVVAFHRWMTGAHVDAAVPRGASPMGRYVALCLGGAAWMWVYGFARGGSDVASSLWQMQRVIYLPLVFFLFQIALRGAKDRAALGKVILAAACIKAVLAIYVRATVAPPPNETVLQYATNHADSMLFALAAAMVIANLLERFDRRRLVLCALTLPLLAAGMIANHRRVVWVELAAAIIVLMVITPRTAFKRSLARGAVYASPFALVYCAIGWHSSSSVFGPVSLVRSIVDSKADGSTEWRDWENYNLFFTLRQGPLFGSGYGHGYIELVKLPDISGAYSLYRFIPHNSILSIWAYGGLVGFAALWTMFVVGMFLAVRAYGHAASPTDRAAALTATAAVVVYLVHCYGDMGLGTWTSVFTVAPAFAVASQLALATGAWRARARAPEPEPEVVFIPRPSPPVFEAKASS